MKKLLVALLFASPLSAQVSQAKFDSLVAVVTAQNARLQLVEEIIGTTGFMSPAIPCDQMESRRPTAFFPNGEYDLSYRNKQFGCFANGIVGAVASLQARTTVLELRPATTTVPSPAAVLSGVTQFAPSAGDIGFQFNTGTVTHRFYANPADYGLRLWFNYREPYINGSSYSVPTLPQMALFFEQDGVASFIYGKPQATAAGPYDALRGKDFAIRSGGWRDDGQREKFVSLYSGNVGRGLQLGVSRTNPNYPDRFDFQIDPAGGDNPVSITLGGVLRNLKPCVINGVNAVCF